MEKNTVILIKKLNPIIKLKLDKYDEKRGISTLSCVIVDYIYYYQKKNKPVTQHDLEKEFYLSKSTCSDLLNALEVEEYIKRSVDNKDARKKNILILPKGEALFEYNKQKFRDVSNDLCSSLSKEEKKVFNDCLLKILKNTKGGKYGTSN